MTSFISLRHNLQVWTSHTTLDSLCFRATRRIKITPLLLSHWIMSDWSPWEKRKRIWCFFCPAGQKMIRQRECFLSCIYLTCLSGKEPMENIRRCRIYYQWSQFQPYMCRVYVQSMVNCSTLQCSIKLYLQPVRSREKLLLLRFVLVVRKRSVLVKLTTLQHPRSLQAWLSVLFATSFSSDGTDWSSCIFNSIKKTKHTACIMKWLRQISDLKPVPVVQLSEHFSRRQSWLKDAMVTRVWRCQSVPCMERGRRRRRRMNGWKRLSLWDNKDLTKNFCCRSTPPLSVLCANVWHSTIFKLICSARQIVVDGDR